MLFDNIDLLESYSQDLIKQSMELSKTAANFRKQNCLQIGLTGTKGSLLFPGLKHAITFFLGICNCTPSV